VISTSISLEPRWTVKTTLSSGSWENSGSRKGVGWVIRCPSSAVRMSPVSRPPPAAGEPASGVSRTISP